MKKAICHTRTRVLQEEIRCLQRAFNVQFAKLHTLKQQELERINEKGKRIEAIQKVSPSRRGRRIEAILWMTPSNAF